MDSNAPVVNNQTDLDRERLISLINSLSDGVIAVNQDLIIDLYNAEALNILDINQTIQGQPLTSYLQIYDKNDQPLNIEQLIKRTKTVTASRDYLLHYQDGSKPNLYLSISPVHLGYGQEGDHGYVLVLRDITHEKSLEEERDEFISVVSHELRTPVAIAEGNVSNAQVVVDRGGDISAVKEALNEAHEQIIFLSGLFNDLSTLSRAERGKLAVEVSTIDVNKFLRELTDSYADQITKKGLQLETAFNESIGSLNSAELYIEEIMQNFITNAIKYTEEGKITIGGRAVDGGIELWVGDSGIGISRGDQEKIFNKFFRSEDYRTRATNGTGLGLYIVKKLCSLIDAKVTLQSELNKGSTFTIYIPNLEKS